MRVLAVGNMYPPHHLGGYELVWRSAVEHLRRAGHEVRVLTTGSRTATTEPDDPGTHRELRWYWRDGGFPGTGYRERIRLERHNHAVLRRHLDDLRPDAVTWWSMGGMSLSLIEHVRRRGVPAVAFVHDDWLDYGRHADAWLAPFGAFPWLAPLAERVFGVPARVDLDGVARWVFVSEATRARALALGLSLGPTAVAHSGIDPAFLGGVPATEWRWRLLYAGRIDARKGVATAVEALAHLPAEATLTVAGGGDEREEARLRAQATALGLAGRVRFAGHHSRDELLARYADADAVVFPVTWEEPWGLVPLEAMAQARPVVATGRGGSAEYLRDEDNCLLFATGDARALAERVQRLATSPQLRARLVAGGRETAARHTDAVLNAAVEQAVTAAVRPQPPPRSTLSVVIPTFRRPDALARTLDALEPQTVGPEAFEVVVVDDPVEDDAGAVAAAVAAQRRPYPVRQVSRHARGVSAARNAGWRAAHGDLVLFLGDDILAGADLLAQHLAWHGRHRGGEPLAVLGHIRWAGELRLTPFMRWLEEGIQFDYPAIPGTEASWAHFYTANISLPRALLEDVGGFDEERFPFLYEDIDLGRRLADRGLRVRYNRAAEAEHLHPTTIDQWRSRMAATAGAERRWVALRPEMPAYFHDLLAAAAACPPVRARGARALARFVPRRAPLLGPAVWRRADLHYRQQLAPGFLAAWRQAERPASSGGSEPAGPK